MQYLDRTSLTQLASEAADSPRRRRNRNLHAGPEDAVQRMLNAFEPGTYVRPHRHGDPPKWELFVALQGRAAVLQLDAAGTVTERAELAPGGAVSGVEIPAGTWHTLVSLEAGTVLLEVKPGPFEPLADKDFAPWAPAEGEAGALELEARLRRAGPGDRVAGD